jgi:PKD repeat protein
MSAANSGALAYAYYPGSVATYVNNDIIDGIIVMSVGVGMNDPYSRPVIGHESGHWMNLAHTWGGTNNPGVDCSGDDGVDDTPPTKGSYGVCNVNRSECNPPVIENEQNIMNYSTCHFMYTKGQVLRMHAALESPVSGRTTLWSPANLLATGTDQPLTYPNPNSCAIPVADFAVNKRLACLGDPVRFTDVSWNAEIQSRTWTFPADADLGTSTTADVSPTVRFNTPGWQQVTLEVTNTNGSNSKVKSMVYVSEGTAILAPYFEGFEDATEVQTNWQSLNYDNNNTTFQRFSGAGHYSNSCAKLNLYNAQLDGDKDEYLSPLLDLSPVDPGQMTLSFDYSFATYDANHMNDSIAALAVYASNNCGATWNRLYFNPGGYNLYNGGTYSSGPYTPGQQDEYWQNVTLNIPQAYQGIVNFKVSVISARGANHFYLDNINIGQSVAGISHISSPVSSMVIAPNPTQGSATLSLMMSSNTDASIKMVDMTGREVMTLYSGLLPAGQKSISFDTQAISSGIYMIRISDGKTSVQKRFVKL